MATLIPADGSEPRYIEPATGPSFTLQELQTLIGGYLEILQTRFLLQDTGQPLLAVFNEEGKLRGLPVNHVATTLLLDVIAPTDVIVGPVILCTTREAGEDE